MSYGKQGPSTKNEQNRAGKSIIILSPNQVSPTYLRLPSSLSSSAFSTSAIVHWYFVSKILTYCYIYTEFSLIYTTI